MINRDNTFLAPLGCIIIALTASPAFARTASASHPIASDFDLSSHGKADDGGQRYRVRNETEGKRFRKGDLGPHVTYNPVSGGPTLEFGALGAGRKGTPGLAHVGVDWSF